MKVSKILARLLTIVLVVLLCFMVAGAAGTPGATSERKSSVTITFGEKPPPGYNLVPGGGGGGGGGGGSGSTTVTIADSQIPLDTVTILDPEVPLGTLGDLPETGSDTGDVFVTLSLMAAGCAMLLAARRNGAGIMA